MGNPVAHDHISALNGDIVNEQLSPCFTDSDGGAQQGLVLLTILHSRRVCNIPNDAVVVQCVLELLGGKSFEIDSSSCKRGISGSKTGEFGCVVDGSSEIRCRECFMKSAHRMVLHFRRLSARLRIIKDSVDDV